jgi:hypothetical protein
MRYETSSQITSFSLGFVEANWFSKSWLKGLVLSSLWFYDIVGFIGDFLSTEGALYLQAMVAALGSVKDYTLKSYLVFAEKLRNKAEVCVHASVVCQRCEK